MWANGRAMVACVIRNNVGGLLLVAGLHCECASVEDAETRAEWEAIRLLGL